MADSETILRNLIKKIAREQNFDKHDIEIKHITSGGANYTSKLFLITVKFDSKKNEELFAKVACVADEMRVIMNATRLYYLETFFYNKLLKTYKELEIKHGLTDEDGMAVPKYYGCNLELKAETVVLENLVARGYGSYNRFISVDWEHAASSIEELAKFHALSFAYQKDRPEEYEEVCRDLMYVDMKKDDSVKEWFGKMVEKSLTVVNEENRARVLQLLGKMGDSAMTAFRQPGRAKVIVHGDFRPSNLLYKRQGNKVHAITVDYQTIHTGCPAADFVYFVLSGTDSKFRAEHHDRLVDHYHTELSAALQRLGLDATEVYPKEEFESEVKRLLPYTIVLGIVLLPIVLVEAENAPRIDRDDALESFMIPSNDLYAERFSGLIEDCIRWGFL